MEPLLFIFLGTILVLGVWVIAQYNGLIALRNHVRESWSGIDTELKRRYDLIPNLVETVKAYAKHEKETLDTVIRLRNQCAANHGSVASQVGDEKQLVQAVGKLIALAEAYPDLKAHENFAKLKTELINTENRIQAARRFFNGNVRDYRVKIESFPSNLIANAFGFKSEDYFDVDPSVREVPKTDF